MPNKAELSILTDKLCSYLKVQTVSKRQVLGNAVFENDLLTSRLRYGQLKSAVSLSLTAQSRCRERRHCTELALAAWGSTGDIFQMNESKVFFKKFARVVSVYLLWKKSRQKGLKVAKYSA